MKYEDLFQILSPKSPFSVWPACLNAQAWVRQYKLDFDAIQAEYLNEFDVRALPTPSEYVKFLKQVRAVGLGGIFGTHTVWAYSLISA